MFHDRAQPSTARDAVANSSEETMPHHLFVVGMSRSGTTLLATVLDAHPQISMAYELLPGGLPPAARCAELVDEALRGVGDDPRAIAKQLRGEDAASLATFVRRAARTHVPPANLVELFRAYATNVQHRIDSIQGRACISAMVIQQKQAIEGTVTSGFKLNSPSINEFDKVFDDARYLYILRDPRDVLVSHISNNFDRSTREVAQSWNNYLEHFEAFKQRHPSRAALLRYEDLVRRPQATLERAFGQLFVPFDSSILDFFNTKARTQARQHNNAENLSRGFFTTSVSRWCWDLDRTDLETIEDVCYQGMFRHGYRPIKLKSLKSVGDKQRDKMAESLKAKRKFYGDEYGRLLETLSGGAVNLTWKEAAGGEEPGAEKVLIVRHDIDHDLDTALQLARWESDQGIRATYCALHTAWYYGDLCPEGYRHTDFLVESLIEIQRLGHEINLHNNFGVVALQTGRDPMELMHREICALRCYGIDIRGTSTHGDRLCRDLDFRNYELFAESVYAERGGPRTVEHHGNRIRLGEVSMAELGLEYEAYDLPRDVYVTDSGGRLRYKRGTRGRGGLRRKQLAEPPPYAQIVGLLAHPVWWDMGGQGGRTVLEMAENPSEWPAGAA